MKAEIKGNEMVITLPIAKRGSKSGKTTIVAGTNGFLMSTATVDEKPVMVSVNCYIK